MAGSSVSTANKVTRFQKKVRREYVREGRFGPHTGTTPNSVFQVNKNLKKTSIALITKLKGAGVEGSTSLVGNEEAIANYEANGRPKYHRHGTLVDNEENELSEFELFDSARPLLMDWTMEHKRDMQIQALGAIEAGGTYYNYGGSKGATGATAASAANMDTWNTNNGDRILYGSAVGNRTAGDHTTSLGTIDTTADKMDRGMVELLKRRAKNAAPIVRPIMLKGDEPWYILYIGSYAFRDLRADLETLHSNGLPRHEDNPLWSGGDLVWDAVVIKEVPEIDIFIDGDSTGSPWDGVWGANATGDSLATAGDSSSRVGIGFLCGGQAVGLHIGRPARFVRRKEDDYEHQAGIGVTMKHDIKKIFYNNKQHGMVTSFHSAATDS